MIARRTAWIIGSQLGLLTGIALQSDSFYALLDYKSIMGFLAAEGAWLIAWATYSFKDEPLGTP